MNSHWPVTAFLASIAVLALAPAAQAALPKFSDKEIVINKSLAGVKLGASPKSGKEAWGKKGARCATNVCHWEKNPKTFDGEANFGYIDGKITAIKLYATFSNETGKVLIRDWMRVPKTSKGIGIGSTRKQLKKAYPKAKETADNFFAIEKGRRTTSFAVDKKSKRIFDITMTEVPE